MIKKRQITYRWEFTTNSVKNPNNTNIFGPYLKAVIWYGGNGLSTCIYIGKKFKFEILELVDGRWKKFLRKENV